MVHPPTCPSLFACPVRQWAGLMRWPSGPMPRPGPPRAQPWFLATDQPLTAVRLFSGWWGPAGRASHPAAPSAGVGAVGAWQGVAAGTRDARLAPAWFQSPGARPNALGGGALGRGSPASTSSRSSQRQPGLVALFNLAVALRCCTGPLFPRPRPNGSLSTAGTWRQATGQQAALAIAGSILLLVWTV